jgi:hypothetical protein
MFSGGHGYTFTAPVQQYTSPRMGKEGKGRGNRNKGLRSSVLVSEVEIGGMCHVRLGRGTYGVERTEFGAGFQQGLDRLRSGLARSGYVYIY